MSKTENQEQVKKHYQADIVIIGLGPVGLLAAINLARSGYSVVGVERHNKPYPLPRAVTFDHEIARILNGIGIDPEADPSIVYYEDRYPMITATGEVLQEVDWISRNPDGFRNRYWFYQPLLEDRLREIAANTPGVTLVPGYEAVKISQDNQYVYSEFHKTIKDETRGRVLDSDDAIFVTAKYGLGSDGQNSFVRSSLGIQYIDMKVYYDWLVLDMILHEEKQFSPSVHYQLCDPVRPTTVVPGGGPNRRRWEFMLLPGETVEELTNPDKVWSLLKPFDVTPQNAEIHRNAVHHFQAKYADKWRNGRWFIAGDAAHLMPPFAGEGMCAGLRDVMNLTWRLDLVLSGRFDDKMLDDYGSERKPHAKAFIEFSVSIAEVVCVIDPKEAEERNNRMTAAWKELSKMLKNGLWPNDNPLGEGTWIKEDKNAGLPSRQGIVTYKGKTGRWDDVIGRPWALLTRQEAASAVSESTRKTLERLNGIALTVGSESSAAELIDTEGKYQAWFADIGCDHIILRPDYYVAGTAVGDAVNDIVARLAKSLRPVHQAIKNDAL